MSKSRRSFEKRVATQEIQASKTVESAVSQVLKAKTSSRWSAKDVLQLYGEFVKGDRFKDKPLSEPKGRGYSKTKYMSIETDGKYARAFARVASEPTYDMYMFQLLEVYCSDVNPNPFSIERCSEFEIKLEISLEKRPFVDYLSVDQAKDAYDALVPISACGRMLGVTGRTIHRWIDKGLSGVMHRGVYKAVVKKGSQYYVNFLAARDWMDSHHNPNKQTRLKVNGEIRKAG